MNKPKLHKLLSIFWWTTSLLLLIIFTKNYYLHGWDESKKFILLIPIALIFGYTRWKQSKNNQQQ